VETVRYAGSILVLAAVLMSTITEIVALRCLRRDRAELDAVATELDYRQLAERLLAQAKEQGFVPSTFNL
jgi:hypothetical protein